MTKDYLKNIITKICEEFEVNEIEKIIIFEDAAAIFIDDGEIHTIFPTISPLPPGG